MLARPWLLLLMLTAVVPAAPDPAKKEASPAEQAALFADAAKRAEAGDPQAMLERAMDHLVGFGTPIDRKLAGEWLRRAAEAGNTDAYFMYGQVCQRGELRTKDLPEAIRWFRKAAERQNADAELSLAQCYENGQGVGVDAKEARRWLELSATHGHPIAQENLALEIGETTELAPLRQANEWLRKSAMQGNAAACLRLGANHIIGRGTAKDLPLGLAWVLVGEMAGDDEDRALAQNLKRGAGAADLAKAGTIARGIIDKMELHPIYSNGPRWLAASRAFKAQYELALSGKAEAQYRLACMHHAGQGTLRDPVEAFRWCRLAAEQGHPQAMTSLACSYRDGDGVAADEKAMIVWFRKAAEAGDADAQWEVSDYLRHRGNGKADMAEADVWLRKSAEQGHPVSQSVLGSLLMETGDDGKKSEAIGWFKRSAMQGYPKGMFKYGMMLYLGYGVPKNQVEGAAWLIACDPGDDESLRTAIKDVLAKVPADSLTKAKATAEEIRKLF